MTQSVVLATGQTVSFEIAAARPEFSTCFLLGIRKCGSSIMNSMMTDIAKHNGREYVDVAGKFFEAGIRERNWRFDPAASAILVPGHVYGGFRAFPPVFGQSPVFQAARKVLLVRDPRDALVSEYFSTAYSHSLPAEDSRDGLLDDFIAARERAQASAIKDFVLGRAAELNRTFLEYQPVLADPGTRLFRYEDVILKKRDWVCDMAAHFGWPRPPDGLLDAMMGWADVLPDQERPTEFVRKVTPGDHRAKLRPEVIAELNQKLAPAMTLFGYS